MGGRSNGGAALEFRVLGPLEALRQGVPIALGGDKQRALLALLLLRANETLASERLIDELWGAHAPGTAAKTLQVHVSRLRKALAAGGGEDLVVTRSHGYGISLAPEQIDSHRFERLVAHGGAEIAAGRAQAAADALEEALTLWRGPPLADLAYEAFAQHEITRLEELRIAALEALVEAKLALGRHGEVVPELERLVAEHPYREALHAQLMLALYRSERQADALHAYRTARHRLVEDLGIEPGERLRELERAILAQDPALAGPAQPPLESPAERAAEDFVGRESELAALRGALQSALAGRGGLVLLAGEPGIGKSRLAEELIAEARRAGAELLVGRCWEAGGAPTYWPWVQALRMHLETVDAEALRRQLGSGAGEIAHVLPELREMFGDLPAPSGESEEARFRLFDATARFLASAAAARPLVVVLDDLHAADEPSLLLLRFVATTLAANRILVVGTYRDVDPTVRDQLAATLAELGRERVTRRIELGGLTERDVARYMQLTSATAPHRDLVAAIHRETEGNPLFVGEVVRLLATEGAGQEYDLANLGVPHGVREVIGRRVGRLSEDCRQLLALASVLGREFRLDALERLGAVEADRLLDLLDEAVAERLLVGAPNDPLRLRFAHVLIRETLYDGLTPPRRAQLHRRVGEALEGLYSADPEPYVAELAHHFFRAGPHGDPGKALDYARRAADRAVGALAYEEGARFYDLTLQALDLGGIEDEALRCELLLELGDALAKAGSMQASKDRFLAAAGIARGAYLPEQLARAALGYGGRYPFARAGSDRRLVPLLEEALGALDARESLLRVRLTGRLAAALRDEPSLERRSSLGAEAVEMARRLGDAATLADALMSHFTASWTPEVDRLLAITDEVRRLAESIGDTERAFQATFLDNVASLTAGDPERVARMMGEGTASDVLEQPALRWWSLVMRSVWTLLQGDFEEGERLVEEALRVGGPAQSWDAGFSYRIALFVIRREQGRLEEVDELIRESVGEYPAYRSFRCVATLVDCELDRPAEATARFEELAADDFAGLPRDAEWLFCLAILSEVAVRLGDTDRAAALHRLLLPYERLFALASGEVSAGCVARYLGILAASCNRWEDAARHFGNALVLNGRMNARPWVAHTQADYGRMLISRGSRERGEALLAAARATFDELGIRAPVTAR